MKHLREIKLDLYKRKKHPQWKLRRLSSLALICTNFRSCGFRFWAEGVAPPLFLAFLHIFIFFYQFNKTFVLKFLTLSGCFSHSQKWKQLPGLLLYDSTLPESLDSNCIAPQKLPHPACHHNSLKSLASNRELCHAVMSCFSAWDPLLLLDFSYMWNVLDG